jgi:hypothetical protein
MVIPLLMGDAPSAELRAAQRAALRLVDWSNVLPRIELFALSRRVPPWQAAEITQNVAGSLFEGETMWDPAKQPDVVLFMIGAVRNAVQLARKSHANARRVPLKALDSKRASVSDDATTREARAAEMVDLLRVALAGDAEALGVLDLTIEGIGKSAEQAARLGVPVGKVYDAKDRIKRHGKRIARELAAEQEEEVAE